MFFMLQACERSSEVQWDELTSSAIGSDRCTRLQQQPWKAVAARQKRDDGEVGTAILKTKDLNSQDINILMRYLN
jgi:hypothetical protein